jgi:plastocyanin
MRRLLIAVLALAALAAAPPGSAATTAVRITRTAFLPTKVTIKTGDAVKWTNRDTIDHQVVANNGAFASPVLHPSKSYTFRFKASGTYRYHDGLHPTIKGTVVVLGPPPAVSISASQPTIVYGQQITLSGVVSNQKANEKVEVYSQPYPQSSFAQVTTVLTGTGGAWSFVVSPGPRILTSYQARWNATSSTIVTVGVQPRIRLTHSGSRFSTRVIAGRSFAGRTVYVERLSRFGQWVKLKKLRLGSSSGRVFRLRLPHGVSRLRVTMSVNQAGPGYLAGFSPTLRVRRR